MNISTSECSSGCESGWTMYLDQSSNSADQFQKGTSGFKAGNEEEYDEDEDLSMVSDASSGPPQFQEDEDSYDGNGYPCSVSRQPNKKEKNKKKVKEQRGSKKQYSNLDDTASSPVKKQVAFPPHGTSMEHNLGFSQGFSATHFKGKSALHKHIGFFRSSVPGKPASGASGDLQGRKWE
ncbi:hypothetical protein Vadar_028363 [Vaccinium darrowii]|uniref:Uncharacterized protein n=1 Tax=Vaccinium darrowii TaxID=229202 RepID=A0ACB7YAR2_9ERIC|nr:hypothetical protein Vadar_028363 [Vaccinium darrowii]